MHSGKGTLHSGKGTLHSGKGTLHGGKGTLHGGKGTLHGGKGTLHGGNCKFCFEEQIKAKLFCIIENFCLIFAQIFIKEVN